MNSVHGSEQTSNDPGSRSAHHGSRQMEPPFSIPDVELSIDKIEKSRPAARRAGKLNMLSRLFSASRRSVKASRKSSRALGKNKATTTNHNSGTKQATISSTAMHLSQDSAQVFQNLRASKRQAPGERLIRQKSEGSIIGSILEIPSLSSSSAEGVTRQRIQADLWASRRSRLSAQGRSFRNTVRTNRLERAASNRSIPIRVERPIREAPIDIALVPSTDSVASTTPKIEISPGIYQTLRGHQETLRYVRNDDVACTVCLSCGDSVYSVNDAMMVVCPTCRSISPTGVDGDGLALGFHANEWLAIQREALAMQ